MSPPFPFRARTPVAKSVNTGVMTWWWNDALELVAVERLNSKVPRITLLEPETSRSQGFLFLFLVLVIYFLKQQTTLDGYKRRRDDDTSELS